MKKPSSIIVVPLLLFGMVSTLLVCLVGCGKPSTIKVGVIAELTGEMPAVGKSCVNAAKLAIVEINDAGGIKVAGNKYKIELVIKDDKADPEKAASAARELIDNDKVIAIVGPNASSGAIEAGKVANSKGVLFITPWSTNPKTTVNSKTGKPLSCVYRACFTDTFESGALGRFAAMNLKSVKAAILYDSSADVLKSQAEIFRKSYEENGGTVVAAETYKEGDKDFSASLDRIKPASPDLIFLPSYYEDAARQAKQIREKGINAAMLGSDAWSTPDLIKTAGADVEGAYVFNHYAADSPDPKTKEFVQLYNSKYGKNPDDIAALTYDSFGLLREALEGAVKLDSASVLAGMGKVKEYSGATGLISYKNGSHDPVKAGVILRIMGGKFTFSAKVYPEPTKEDVVAFVNEALEYVEENGKEKALAEFNDPNGSFQRGELYIYAYNWEGNCLAFGSDPSFVGTNRLGLKDPNGVMTIQELIQAAKSGKGWVSYIYENPQTKKPQKKQGYAVKVDDTWWLGSGRYE